MAAAINSRFVLGVMAGVYTNWGGAREIFKILKIIKNYTAALRLFSVKLRVPQL
ncbi:MAG: hypothetical protein ACR2NN_21245 [Bryobacteraceae bacterium]